VQARKHCYQVKPLEQKKWTSCLYYENESGKAVSQTIHYDSRIALNGKRIHTISVCLALEAGPCAPVFTLDQEVRTFMTRCPTRGEVPEVGKGDTARIGCLA